MKKALLILLYLCTLSQSAEDPQLSIRAFYVSNLGSLSKSYREYQGINYTQYEMVRASSLKGLFLRAKSAGYNYVFVNMMMSYGWERDSIDTIPSNIIYPLNTPSIGSPIPMFKEALEFADSFGIKVIPVLNVCSSGGGDNWHLAQRHSHLLKENSLNHIKNGYSTPLASDSAVDTIITRIFKSILNEYKSAHLSYSGSIPYVLISFDENWESNDTLWQLPGSGSHADSAFLMKNYNSCINRYSSKSDSCMQSAYRKLYAYGLLAKSRLVCNVFGSSTKTLVLARSFDPTASDGTIHWHTKLLPTATITLAVGENKVLDGPGLTPSQLDTLKKRVILMPWDYGDSTYNFDSSYAYFSNSGYKFAVFSAIPGIYSQGDTSPTIKRIPYESRTIDHVSRHIAHLKQYPKSGIGYFAAFYPCSDPSIKNGACAESSDPAVKQERGIDNYWISTNSIYDQYSNYDILELLPHYYNKQ